ncbi:hypothetical protein PENSPDRAFT_271900 [Peniophora sp. CONT]|nr:hypothetical protein PENSPDRAFT_271900 [Peniophora sp. CONT]
MLSACVFALASLPVLVSAGARVVGFSPLGALRASTGGSDNGSLDVTVAPNNATTFDPPNVNATVGQMINFHFPTSLPVSVTQSYSFGQPCTYLNFTNGTIGFDSDLTTRITFTIQITDNEPIYFHCKHPGHCGSGMVGTINAPLEGAGSGTEFQGLATGMGSNAPNDTSGQASGDAGANSTTIPDTSSATTNKMGYSRVWTVLLGTAVAFTTAVL